MWWLIAWAVLSLITWLLLAFMVAAVPSSERVSNSDMLKLAGISLTSWAVAVVFVYGATAALQGIF